MPLRELALLLIIPTVCVIALFRPQIGLYGYLWYAIVRPDVMAFCVDKYPFSMGLAVATLLGSMRYARYLPGIFRIPIVQWLLALQIPIGLSIVFCEHFLSMDRYILFEQTTLMLLLFPLIIRSETDMRGLLYTFGSAGAVLGCKFGLFGLVSGGALLNQNYGYVYDNNELALAIAMLMPVCWYCRHLTSVAWLKHFFTIGILGSGAGVIMTNSRGASLALGTIVIVLICRSQRRLPIVIGLILSIGPGLYLVRDQYFSRMETIEHYQDDESAAHRVDLWKAAIDMWADYPLLGVGFGNRNFARLSTRYMRMPNTNVVHNSYLQMLVDSGIFAFLIYTGLLFGTIVWLGKAAAYAKQWRPGLDSIPLALQVPLIGFAVGSTFYSHQRYDLTYMLLMASAAWYQIQRTELVAGSEEAPEEALIRAGV